MEFLISCLDGKWLDLDDEHMISILTTSHPSPHKKAVIDPKGGYRVSLANGEVLVSAEPPGWQIAFVNFTGTEDETGQYVQAVLKAIEMGSGQKGEVIRIS